MKRIGIVGGGVAGVSAALYLGHLGYEVELFEKRQEPISGPPFCHLHAGGNLYREISDDQCLDLLRQSVAFARLYPFALDRRPTVVAVPLRDGGDPKALLPRLKRLRQAYARLVAADRANAVLGDPSDYFRLYTQSDLAALARRPSHKRVPKSPDEWMVPLARAIDSRLVRFPLILVQEYGLNLFRLAAGAKLALAEMPNVTLRFGCEVRDIEAIKEGYELRYGKGRCRVDYLINAAGYRTGAIDAMLKIFSPRMVEFKAAYATYWPGREPYWPEVIFHGKRGTPEGMGQFTPYSGGFVQLHAMTRSVTLFQDGLATASEQDWPRLPERFERWIEKGWPDGEVRLRTRRAIAHLARFIPAFAKAQPGGPPLFGAQQIPGEDLELRVAEVAFARPRYARCEIVKVSSVTDMVRAIVKDLGDDTPLPPSLPELEAVDRERLADEAARIAASRGFDPVMSKPLAGEDFAPVAP